MPPAAQADVRFSPGDWIAVTSEDGWLLADLDPTDVTVLVCWQLLRTGAPFDAILDALLAKGLRSVRGFALARRTGEGVAAVVVRGTGAVTVERAGDAERISGQDVATWREVTVPAGWAALELAVRAGDAGEAAEPAGAGVALSPGITLAGSIRVAGTRSETRGDRHEPSPVPERAPAAAPAPVPIATEAMDVSDLADEPDLDDQFAAPSSPADPITVHEPAHPVPAPEVDTVRCERGHLNPLTVGVCRVCGLALQPQVPQRRPRPPLGVLRVSVGDRHVRDIALDQDLIVGRRPDPTDVGLPGDARTVVVDSPDQDVSRTHFAIHLEGWLTLIADLKSTNGTVLTAPGRDPVRLSPNQAVPLEPGTVVSVADRVHFRYDATV